MVPDPETFVRGCPILTTFFFLVDEKKGEMIKVPLEVGHHHWPASETPFKWHFAGINIEFWPSSFAIFQFMRTSIAKKTYFL